MAVITSTPIAVAHRDEGFLSAGISASATTITIGAITKWVNGVKTTGGFNTTGGFAEITISDRFELVSFGTAAVDSTTKVTTLTDVRRGISVTAVTQSLAAGTGIAWPKGATIRVVDSANYIQHTVFKDVANTYTALQTFNTLEFATSGDEYLRTANLTTTERNALTGANGMIIYNETTGVHNQYIGGAWATFATGTTSNASETVAGKVEIATAAEVRAETSTGGTGADLVIPADITTVLKDDKIVLKDETELTISSGAITVTQPYHKIDTESAASGDALVTINAAVGAGEVIYVGLENSARMINFKDGDGNLTIPGGDYTLADFDEILCFIQEGTNWKMVGPRGSVVGEMKIWTTNTAPIGWLLCDGSALNASSAAQYQNLFDTIANAFGGSNNTNFKVPDMRGRIPLGQDDMGGSSANRVTDSEADTVGSSEGAEAVTSSDHTHSMSVATTVSSGSGSTVVGASATGSDGSESLNLMNPYLTLNYIIRY